jgi:signal transduction histidine kinase
VNRVLIVDDKASNLYFLRVLLEGHGFHVEEAHNGREALDKALLHPPHLMISDLLMPEMDGYELLRHWKSNESLRHIPFVVYTATYTEQKDEELALQLGADAFIIKPTEPEPFIRQVCEVLDQVRANSPTVATPSAEENVTLRLYNEVLVRKLEQKCEQLEQRVAELKATEVMLQSARVSAEQATAEAQKANQAKDHFLAVLSHELRTPLTPVLAAVQLLQRRPGLSAEVRQPLEVVQRNAQLQARLIDDLLDLTRIAHGKLELNRKPTNVCTIVERAVEIAQPDMDARRLRFRVSLKDRVLWVHADASRIQQVIWNLLTNAVKFTPEGGHVELKCERQDDHVLIEVSDSGVGVEPHDADRIFDAFEQGGLAMTRQFGGLGLGLAIAKRLVEMHDGKISVSSEGRSRGATFRVQLPLCNAELPENAQENAESVPGGSRRILLVEDNGDTAQMMKMLLTECGYVVETAADIRQALEAAGSGKFDLLLSDLGLPDGSGTELMQELRRRGNMLKGIALSGYGQEEDMRRSKEAGFSAHLIKPADADVLIETISEILQAPRSHQP